MCFKENAIRLLFFFSCVMFLIFVITLISKIFTFYSFYFATYRQNNATCTSFFVDMFTIIVFLFYFLSSGKSYYAFVRLQYIQNMSTNAFPSTDKLNQIIILIHNYYNTNVFQFHECLWHFQAYLVIVIQLSNAWFTQISWIIDCFTWNWILFHL